MHNRWMIMKLKHLLLIPPCIAPSLCRNLINQGTSIYILSRDAPILISVSLLANIGHIFDIGTLGIGNIGTDIGILVKVSLASQFHKCMNVLIYKCHNSKLKFSV